MIFNLTVGKRESSFLSTNNEREKRDEPFREGEMAKLQTIRCFSFVRGHHDESFFTHRANSLIVPATKYYWGKKRLDQIQEYLNFLLNSEYDGQPYINISRPHLKLTDGSGANSIAKSLFVNKKTYGNVLNKMLRVYKDKMFRTEEGIRTPFKLEHRVEIFKSRTLIKTVKIDDESFGVRRMYDYSNPLQMSGEFHLKQGDKIYISKYIRVPFIVSFDGGYNYGGNIDGNVFPMNPAGDLSPECFIDSLQRIKFHFFHTFDKNGIVIRDDALFKLFVVRDDNVVFKAYLPGDRGNIVSQNNYSSMGLSVGANFIQVLYSPTSKSKDIKNISYDGIQIGLKIDQNKSVPTKLSNEVWNLSSDYKIKKGSEDQISEFIRFFIANKMVHDITSSKQVFLDTYKGEDTLVVYPDAMHNPDFGNEFFNIFSLIRFAIYFPFNEAFALFMEIYKATKKAGRNYRFTDIMELTLWIKNEYNHYFFETVYSLATNKYISAPYVQEESIITYDVKDGKLINKVHNKMQIFKPLGHRRRPIDFFVTKVLFLPKPETKKLIKLVSEEKYVKALDLINTLK